MQISLRAGTLEDADSIARVEVETWRATYIGLIPESVFANRTLENRQKAWASILSRATSDLIVDVAECEGVGVVGFCEGGSPLTPIHGYDAEIVGIYVLPQYQGQRIGKALIALMAAQLMERGARSLFLWTLKENTYRRFYEALGGVAGEERERDFGAPILCIAYLWSDIAELVKRCER